MVAICACGSAPRRPLFTLACILLIILAVWAARQCSTGKAHDFVFNYRLGGQFIRQKGVVGEEELAVDAFADDGREKYLWPLLSNRFGTGNQLVEYTSAAVVARSLNRTLCLTPFQEGPVKHRGTMWHRGQGLKIQERYNMERLAKFVRIASVDQCLSSCNYTLDDVWLLKLTRRSPENIFDENTTDAIWSNGKNLNWSYVSWTTTEDVRRALGRSNQRCVELGGLFPGLRWRGASFAVAAYLTPSDRLEHSASIVRNRIIGPNTKYLAELNSYSRSPNDDHAVHRVYFGTFGLVKKTFRVSGSWESTILSRIAPQELGSCFPRCGDGAIIATGLNPFAEEWVLNSTEKACRIHAVKVTSEDVAGAIYDRALEANLSTVYLATDGWVRGPIGANLVKEVVELLRERKLSIVGFWRIEGLPNFPSANTTMSKANSTELADFPSANITMPKANSTELADLFGVHYPEEEVDSRMVSGVEQEICSRAEVFLGSGQSSWSLAVFRSRVARRRVAEVLKSMKGELNKEFEDLDEIVNNQIIQELLRDKHDAGLLCSYDKRYHMVRAKATKETFADEAPDGWLDLEACEQRLGRKGGQCKFLTCVY